MNRIRGLRKYGQSVWLDTISRDLLTNGKLNRYIEEDGLLGMTSNPAIFEKAIDGSASYDPAIKGLAKQGYGAEGIYKILATQDIRIAADLLNNVYQETNGYDGYVSLEVSPALAHNADGSIKEGLELHAAVGRPNIFIKVPATTEGLPAIRALLGCGISINVTLLFAVERYIEVAHTYLDGLEDLAERGGNLSHVHSVASFFISRIDSLADAWIEAGIKKTKNAKEKARLKKVLGKVAIANAKIAYEQYKDIFGSKRFKALKALGANTQRLLWASTSTKNPAYPDVIYVDSLIGPDTVNTVPEETYGAFRDHGACKSTLETGLKDAHAAIKEFEALGFSMQQLTQQLLDEGVEKFIEPFDKLLAALEKKRARAFNDELRRQVSAVGDYEDVVRQMLNRLDAEKFGERLWTKDPTAWTYNSEHHALISEHHALVKGMLGWLTVCNRQRLNINQFKKFAKDVRAKKFTHVQLLGMGGSSLCPEVLRLTFGRQKGFPQLHVLDSTVPAQVAAAAKALDIGKTLFIVSSKSGGTTEPLAFLAYFYNEVKKLKGEKAGEQFAAITDPGSHLEDLAKKLKFRYVFHGEPEIGGRFSALSNFGMIPAAAAGLDVEAMIACAERMMHRCAARVPSDDNPGVVLGAIMGALAKAGRDKVCIVASPGISHFGVWIEQLLAESTGKEGTGLIPVEGELLSEPGAYGDDRLFVYMRLLEAPDAAQDELLARLAKAGHPVVPIDVPDRLNVAAEIFRWEIAVATAGAILEINAFDQPNVQESKDNTVSLLSEYQKNGVLPGPSPLLESDGVILYADAENSAELKSAVGANGFPAASLEAYLAAHLNRVTKGDYVALNAYVEQNEQNQRKLQALRTKLRDHYRAATTLGFGPRFLHSTGQLHKGGPNSIVVLQITCDNTKDLPIEGEPFTFGVLKDAQALGDFASLSSRHRRALRVHLCGNVGKGIDRLLEAGEAITR